MKIILITILISLLQIGAMPQSRSYVKPKSGGYLLFKVNEKSPSVYLSVEKTTKKQPSNQVSEIVWFVLHNNLKFAIRFCTFDESISKTGQPGIDYEIESLWDHSDPASPKAPIVIRSFPFDDVCDESVLKSGRNFRFGIPRAELVKDTMLKLSFRFPWEYREDVFLGKEARHYVYFPSSHL